MQNQEVIKLTKKEIINACQHQDSRDVRII